MVFGGTDYFFNTYDDTWEWDGSVWTLRTPATRPPRRAHHAMVYDEGRGVVVMFGGTYPVRSSIGMRDTWEWDGENWTHVVTKNSPTAGWGMPALAYDAARQRVVMYDGSPQQHTWEYDGVDWTQRFPANNPGQSYWRAMAYDRARGRVILCAGYVRSPLAETWEWDGSDWTQRDPVARPGVAFPNSGDARMVYDEARGRVVLGGATRGEVWEWDGGNAWIHRDPRPGPTLRRAYSMAYDRARERTVTFGGQDQSPDGSGAMDETWEYYATDPASYVAFGVGCLGGGGTPSVYTASLARPWIGSAFRMEIRNLPKGNATVMAIGASSSAWGATPLPQSLSPIGMPGCTLYVSMDLFVPVPNPASIASLTVPIPNTASMVGQSFYNQCFTVDPGATPLGVIASNAGHARIGAR